MSEIVSAARNAIFFLTANLPAFAIFLVFLNFNDTLAADELLDIAKEFCEDLLDNEIKSEYQSKEVAIE